MSDPAAGKFEMPGGHCEGSEAPRAAATREWQEETGLRFPDGEWTGTWTSPDGIYQGFVYTIAREADLDIFDRQLGSDPDGDVDGTETIAWWDPADLPGNPAVRAELLADIDVVMAALGASPDDGMVSKASVNYRPADGGQCCGNCSMIRQAGGGWSCTLVEGPVDPGAVCDRWDPADEVAKAGDDGPKGPTLHLPSLTGVWGDIYARREKLLRKHAKAVAAAWDECIAELGSPRAMVREFRAGVVPVAKLADPDAKWWKDAGAAAAVAWLLRLSKTKGYPALVAALEDAIRSGMAEGEADALALAADRQGAAGFRIDRAFKAAYDRLAGDAEVARQAQDAAAGMTDGAAGDTGRVLADQAEADGSEQDMADAAAVALAGDQSTGDGTDWAIWAAFFAGATALMGQVAGTSDASGMLNFVTAGDGRVCAVCQDLADGGPYAPQDFPAYPHPRCRCSAEPADNIPSSFFAAYLLS